MNEKDQESALAFRCQIADAKLGVAEELGWFAALFGAAATYFKLNSWFAAIAVGIVIYFIARYRYNRESDTAWDAYKMATKSGEYREE